MSYLLTEMLPCLLLAGLIGTILGWLLRKCQAPKLRKQNIEDVDLSEEIVLREEAATPKMQAHSLVGNIDTKQKLLEDEIVQLRLKLSSAELASKTAEMKLSALETDYNFKLKKAEASFYNRDDLIQDLEKKYQITHDRAEDIEQKYKLLSQEHESKLAEIVSLSKQSDGQVEAIKSDLLKAESSVKQMENKVQDLQVELERLETQNLKLEEEKNSFNQRYETMQKEYSDKLKEVSASSFNDEQKVKSLQAELEDFSAKETELKKQIDYHKKRAEESQSKISSLESKFEEKERELTKFQQEKERLEKDLLDASKAKEEVSKLKASLQEKESEASKRYALMQSEFDSKLNQATQSGKSHEGELQAFREKFEEKERELTKFKAEKERLEKDLLDASKAKEEVSKLKASLQEKESEASKRYALMQSEFDSKLDAVKSEQDSTNNTLLLAQLASMEQKLQEAHEEKRKYQKDFEVLNKQRSKEKTMPQKHSESTTSHFTKKPNFLKQPNGKADDLQRIKGIGGTLNGVLNNLGVYHFSQIASWEKDEIAWVDEHLSFSGRIEREEWVPQAKKLLMSGKESELESLDEQDDPTISRPAFLMQARSQGADNLQLIQGISGQLSGKLQDMGIFHYDQIASWDSKEIAWVNKKLDLNGKIEKEDWIAQAKALMGNETQIHTSKPKFLKAPDGKADNLQLIKGVGEKLHGVLNNLGVYHFSQIASWKPEEISWVDEHLAFPGRIEREGWVLQAKELMMGKETEFSKRVNSGEVTTSKANREDTKLKRHKHTKKLKKK